MDTKTLADLIRSQGALLDAKVMRTTVDRLESQETEIVRLTRRLREVGRELLRVEEQRQQFEAMNRELLARCDLLSCELIQAGLKFPMHGDRACDQAST